GVRIVLALEQRLDVRAIRLRGQDDVNSRWIRDTVRSEWFERPVNFDAALKQQLLELFRRRRIVLLGRNNERGRTALITCLDGARAHVVKVLNDRLPIEG